MLTQLYIKNFAVIKELDISFGKGFNVFTGETGAGKTMLINAVNSILGARINKDIVRNGENKASVLACFSDLSEKQEAYFKEIGYDCPDGEILISRDLTADGRSICKINGKPSTVSMLRDVSKELIAIHGQQDTGHFLNTGNDVDFLDNYGDYDEIKALYDSNYAQYKNIKRQLDEINTDVQQREQKIDILKYQLDEIENADITIGEENELIEERKRIKNSEKIRNALNEISYTMNDMESSLLEQIDLVCSNLEEVSGYLEGYNEISEKCNEMKYEFHDIYETARNDLEEFDANEDDMDAIEDRLELIHRLSRKYGGSEESILEFAENASAELERLSNAEENTIELRDALRKITEILTERAADLTAERIKAGNEFVEKVENELKFLDMPNVKLGVKITPMDFSEKGCDLAEIIISTNPGEPMKPISKIASGGETSRIMLAIKNVIAEKDNIGTLIFDEIDTGVSGTAAQKIGEKLKEVSENHQVICITHLAQVASYGNRHFYIHKDVENGKTFTKAEILNGEQRIRELARIVVGEEITDAALNNAKEMLKNSEK